MQRLAEVAALKAERAELLQQPYGKMRRRLTLRAEAAEAQLAALRAQLEQLAATWEDHAWSEGAIYASGIFECAEELRALLAAQPGPLAADTTCDHDVGRTCRELWPTSRESWCEGCAAWTAR